jgi:ABC-type multidrug transport system fused ATPase/permease subunit
MESKSDLEETTIAIDSSRRISLREVAPVDVTVRDVSVAVDEASIRTRKFPIFPGNPQLNDEESGAPETRILENVSAHMPHGSLTAIIGASGSGKTTL